LSPTLLMSGTFIDAAFTTGTAAAEKSRQRIDTAQLRGRYRGRLYFLECGRLLPCVRRSFNSPGASLYCGISINTDFLFLFWLHRRFLVPVRFV
jgi:hypothetical protein